MKLLIAPSDSSIDMNDPNILATMNAYYNEFRGVQMAPRMENDFIWYLFRKNFQRINIEQRGRMIGIQADFVEDIIGFILTYMSGYDLPEDVSVLNLLNHKMSFQELSKFWDDALPDLKMMLVG